MGEYTSAGVIVELNPLHNGHAEHLRETRRITGRAHIIAVMSGNFVQRGEPALVDKWLRTDMALRAGADVVIELPLPYVLGGADYFARGAVKLLHSTGMVDCLCFGSESGDIDAIKRGAAILAAEPPIYKEAMRAALDAGKSFAAARGAGLAAAYQEADPAFFSRPNNGLGMEYCKAISLLGHPMEVFTSHRKGGGPSATAVRRAVRDNTLPAMAQHLPDYVYEAVQTAHARGNTVFLDDFSDIFRHIVTRGDVPPLEEGLHHRFKKFAHTHRTLTQLLAAAKTKRYTLTRLQRAAMRLILGITPPAHDPTYIRVLGFRQESAHLIGEMTRRSVLPVLVHLGHIKNPPPLLAKEWEAGEIYRLMQQTETTAERRRPMLKR